MATLNQEINLTQNLYQAFLESKARASKVSSSSGWVKSRFEMLIDWFVIIIFGLLITAYEMLEVS